QARAGRYSRQVGHRRDSWEALVEATRLAREQGLGEGKLLELRNEAIACLAIADLRLLKEWPGFPRGSSASPAFDADLEHYARSDQNGTVRVLSVADDRELARLSGQGYGAVFLRFRPQGDLLAILYWRPLPGRST